MITLSLESDTETIDLNSIMDTDEGVQAIAGLTGFGLPPVEVQWAEGAGDGAKYRGRRVLPRDIDLPIYMVAPDEDTLREQVNQLARVLSGEATLRITRWNDILWADEEWTAKVARTGGGDVTYGEDTTGELDMRTTITLRAGSPFWTRTLPKSQAFTGTVPTTMTLVNDGTTDAYPTWTVHGPALGFQLTSPLGELLSYDDYIPEGDAITVDTAAGTVVNLVGETRYSGVSASPRFFPLRPGSNVVTVAVDNTSAAYHVYDAGVVRTNRVLNPNVKTDASNWTLGSNGSRDGAATPPVIQVNVNSSTVRYLYTTVTGLTPGQTYEVRFESGLRGGFRAPTASHWSVKDGTTGPQLGTGVIPQKGLLSVFTVGTFTALSSTATFSYLGDKGTAAYPNKYWIRNLYIGEPGTYFDGETTDTTDTRYDWTGTARASTSTLSTLVTPNTALTGVSVSYNERDWMVV